MWGFFILITVYIEAYGVLFNPRFHIPLIGRWDALAFSRISSAVAVLTGIITFAIIRLRPSPRNTAARHASTARTMAGPG